MHLQWFRYLGLGVVVGGLVVALGYHQFIWEPATARAKYAHLPMPTLMVSTVSARTIAWRAAVRYPGTAKPVRDVSIISEVAGTVDQIGFENGGSVKKGDLLFSFVRDAEQLERRSAQLTLEQADLNLLRETELQAKGAATLQSLEFARLTLSRAAAALSQIDAVMAQKKIHAPFSGAVGIASVEVGDYVLAQKGLVNLHDTTSIVVEFHVPERELADAGVGVPVRVRSPLMAEAVSGIISAREGSIDPATRMMKIQATVRNHSQHLIPGGSVTVDVLGAEKHVVAVPRTAIVTGLEGTAVYVITNPGLSASKDVLSTVERRPVAVGAIEGADVIVISGLVAGETIVTGGQNKLVSGLRVKLSHKQSGVGKSLVTAVPQKG